MADESWKDKLKRKAETHLTKGHSPMKVDEELYNQIQQDLGGGKVLRVMPYPENDGMLAGEEFLQELHIARKKFIIGNDSKINTFEIWYNEGRVQFLFYVTDSRTEQKLRTQIRAQYEEPKIREDDQVFPNIYEGDYVAGSRLKLKKHKYHPVLNRTGVNEMKVDPYRAITTDMVTDDQNRSMIQIVFKPALSSWSQGGPINQFNPLAGTVKDYAQQWREGEIKTTITGEVKEQKATSAERSLAEKIAKQKVLPAYHVNIRILAFSQRPEEARESAWSIGQAFRQTFIEEGDQTFIQEAQNGDHLERLMRRAARRDFVDHGITLTIPELAAVAHLPNDGISNPSVDWNYTETGDPLPPDAERFEESNIDRGPPGSGTPDDEEESIDDEIFDTHPGAGEQTKENTELHSHESELTDEHAGSEEDAEEVDEVFVDVYDEWLPEKQCVWVKERDEWLPESECTMSANDEWLWEIEYEEVYDEEYGEYILVHEDNIDPQMEDRTNREQNNDDTQGYEEYEEHEESEVFVDVYEEYISEDDCVWVEERGEWLPEDECEQDMDNEWFWSEEYVEVYDEEFDEYVLVHEDNTDDI